ncbi:ATP phosphoribosyltransferase regulatory subunit [Alphaproteobacteria bacterium]|nr:ATP phosphoribosyltransferase regulatory subunit [Alphaproteobacteria bacterium]
MISSLSSKGLLPAGLSDILYPDAQIQAKTIEKLLDVFSNYGYMRVKPPLVEYEDSLLSEGPGTVLKDSTFRIMDPLSQKMMALRSDVTAQISRIASTRLSHLPRPLRLSYSGDVLRVKGDSFNMERQKTQVGVELIGPKSELVDSEIILVCCQSLKSINIKNITVDLNLPFLREHFLSSIKKPLKEQINEAIDRKDLQTLKKLKFDNSETIIKLMESAGNYKHGIRHLSELKLDGMFSDVREYLLKVINIIKENDNSINISIDPLENRGFKYHTGLTFTIFSEMFKGEVAKGGSYKTLSGETATGCTIYTEKIYTQPIVDENKNLLYMPYLNMVDADNAIKKGFNVVFGNTLKNNFEQEAIQLKCQYIWKNNTVVKL